VVSEIMTTVENRSGKSLQRVAVFQQNGSGERKIAGVRAYGADIIALEIISIDESLPLVLDDARRYLPEKIEADLALDYLTHQDLSCDLVEICVANGIPIVSSGKKRVGRRVMTPPTCCGLPRQDCLGPYGERFGAPEFEVVIKDGLIAEVVVLRGAPCGATWEAARRMIGVTVADAARKIGLDTQFFCSANPAGWDPIHGKSPVHFAGRVHNHALQMALEKIQGISG
jgi:hypothetical protein